MLTFGFEFGNEILVAILDPMNAPCAPLPYTTNDASKTNLTQLHTSGFRDLGNVILNTILIL